MSLLHSLGLLALAAVPVLVALSLWRWRRREVVVSSLLLWRDVATAWRQTPHARQRRRLDPLVALRVAVALAVTAALCAPVWLRPARLARRVVVVVDRSASMAARRPDGLSRWQACRGELMKLLVRLRGDDRVDVVAVPPPEVRPIPLDLGPGDARAVLLALEASDAAVEPKELVRAAADALRRCVGASVVVATDAALDGLPAGAHVLAAGGPMRNLGITAFAARAARDGRHEVLVTVSNASPEPAAAGVRLFADGREAGRRAIAVGPGASEPLIFEAKLGAAAVLEARLDGRDALAADDRAWLARRPDRLRVALLGDDSPYLRRALGVQSGVELVEPAELPAEAVPRGCGLAVYVHAVPAKLTGGSVVAVAPAGPVGGLRPGPLVAAGEGVAAARRDPLMAAVRLDGVPLGRVRKAATPAAFEVLAGTEGVPLIGRWREGGTRLTYVGIDPAASDWPLDASFPVFWANVVAEAQGREAGQGEFLTARPAEAIAVGGEGEVTLVEPGGSRRTLAAGVFRPETVGLHRIAAGKQERTLAVSLLAERETLAPGEAVALPADAVDEAERGAARAVAWRLGGWAALAALVLAVLHGWASGRGLRKTRDT